MKSVSKQLDVRYLYGCDLPGSPGRRHFRQPYAGASTRLCQILQMTIPLEQASEIDARGCDNARRLPNAAVGVSLALAFPGRFHDSNQ